MMEHMAIMQITRITPGTMPAMNMPPTDTEGPAMKAYTIMAPDGGMIGPDWPLPHRPPPRNPCRTTS
jgi:hypothetical protein